MTSKFLLYTGASTIPKSSRLFSTIETIASVLPTCKRRVTSGNCFLNTPSRRGSRYSAIYYDQKIGLIPQKRLDLRLSSICTALNVPNLGAHDAYTDALTVAIAYVKLKQSDKGLP